MAMQCSHCGLCCHKTEMMLSKTDIQLLKSRGHNKKVFLRLDKQGYAKLQNRRGCCVFYDADKSLCRVYADRPQGCHIYPVVHSEEEGIVVDGLCPMKTTVTGAEMVGKGKEVIRLLKTIDREAKERTRPAHAKS
jgi:Fe-S-cluster containining protein